MRIRLAAVSCAALLLTPVPAFALVCGTLLDPMTVSASGLNFGTYMPANPVAARANATITISCGLGLDLLPGFTVGLSAGGAGAYFPRTMTLGASRLSYNLYADPALLSVWGDDTAGSITQIVTEPVLFGNLAFTAYGRVPPGQFVTPGVYSDTIIVTVTY